MRVDEWHLHDFSCHTFVGGRGLSLGHVFRADGTHVATIAQEVLLRDTRLKRAGDASAVTGSRVKRPEAAQRPEAE